MLMKEDPVENPEKLKELVKPETLWPLRSNLLAIKLYKGRMLKSEVEAELDSLIEWITSYLRFDTSIRVFIAGEDYTKLATLLDLGAFGVVSFQDILSKEEVNFRKVLLGAISEALVVAGSIQYFRQSSDHLEKEIFESVSELYYNLWKLTMQRRQISRPAGDIMILRDGLDELARLLTDRRRKSEERIAVIHMIYRNILQERVESLIPMLKQQ
ncbi:MAG: hypothetical protein QW728_03335 [Thermoplasmata archaeon]